MGGAMMPELLRLALLAVPAGIVGFIAAPCCGLLAPTFLPFAMATDALPVPPPGGARMLLPLADDGQQATATDTSVVVQPVPTRVGVLRGYLAFMTGFCVFFTVLGAGTTAVGSALLDQLPVLEKIAGGVIVGIGILQVAPVRLPLPGRLTCPDTRRVRSGPLGAFGMGFALAIVWTPCTGPTLGGILAAAAITPNVWGGAGLLFLYAVGLSLPFGLMSFALARTRRLLDFQRRHARALEIAGGVVMTTVGVIVLLGGWQSWLGPATGWLSEHGWPPI